MAERDDQVIAAYERMPYASTLQPQTHPNNLATLAFLRGIETATPAQCRVLELGCADGGNLVAMGIELPGSSFVGIDLVGAQIESGIERLQQAGLTNIELLAMSIMDVEPALGTFDFIICHGVYSWVDERVREKILSVCKENLAPNGIAYVSYNTFPGWHLRQMVREMVQFHTRNLADDTERVRQSVELIRLLTDVTGQAPVHPYAMYLRTAREQMERLSSASYFIHEYLETVNEPCYFHQFASRAAAHGLQYVCEADPDSGDADHLQLEGFTQFVGNRIDAEQYVDFAINRAFRRTLLTHGGSNVSARVEADRVRSLYIASAAKAHGTAGTFRTDRGRMFTANQGLAKAVFEALAGAWPESLSFDTLRVQVDGNEPELVAMLDSLYANGAVELDLMPPQVTRIVSERPTASRRARCEALRGNVVTTQRHRVINLDDPIARFLVPLLDGSRDEAELLRLLEREIASGQVVLEPRASDARAMLGLQLRRAAEIALLVA
jgi:SAM-dependent methyltransferase